MSTTQFSWTGADMDRLGRAISTRLTEGLPELPHDVTERLRAARMRAVANRQVAVVQLAKNVSSALASNVVTSGGAAALQGGADESNHSWWQRLASVLPLIALAAGLVLIAVHEDEMHVRELAEVDAELLTDELPPAAYVDPGFAQFMRKQQAQ